MFTKYPLLFGTGIKRLAQKNTEREWGIPPPGPRQQQQCSYGLAPTFSGETSEASDTAPPPPPPASQMSQRQSRERAFCSPEALSFHTLLNSPTTSEGTPPQSPSLSAQRFPTSEPLTVRISGVPRGRQKPALSLGSHPQPNHQRSARGGRCPRPACRARPTCSERKPPALGLPPANFPAPRVPSPGQLNSSQDPCPTGSTRASPGALPAAGELGAAAAALGSRRK